MSSKRRLVPQKAKIDSWYHHIGKHVGSSMCLCCNKIEITQLEFHGGHIMPVSKGGDDSVQNILPICASCNLSMRDKYMDDFQRQLGYTNIVSRPNTEIQSQNPVFVSGPNTDIQSQDSNWGTFRRKNHIV